MFDTSCLDLSLERIDQAARSIDPVFRDTPQFVEESLCAALGREVLVKVETANPVRSFKGRGADFFMSGFDGRQRIVCSSTGNFGQAMAYAARRRGVGVEVFVPAGANPAKLDRMRAFGARVTIAGGDSTECQEAAMAAASRAGSTFVQDGKEPAIAEGAGTIGVELLRSGPLDTIVLPVGDGALIAGVACWVKAHAPGTRVVGVCASGSPSMALSWKAGRPVSTERSATIAEGIEVRTPVPESVARVCASFHSHAAAASVARVRRGDCGAETDRLLVPPDPLVDDIVLVDDDDLLDAMGLAARTLGLLLEPSGVAGLAAIRRHHLPGERLATVLTGSNLRPEHLRRLV